MRQVLLVALLALAVASGCTSPPYTAGPGKDLASLDNDHTDCYSQASLTANTPPYPEYPLRAVDRQCDTCMTDRGYQKQFRPFWF